MYLINLIDTLNMCFPEGLYIEDNTIYSWHYSKALTYKLNFLFKKKIYTESDGQKADDLNKIMKTGKIYNKYKGSTYAKTMLNEMINGHLLDEYAYIRKVIDNSITVKLCIENGLFEFIQAENPLDYSELTGNLDNATSYIKKVYSESFIKIEEKLFSDLCNELENIVYENIRDMRDSAMVITVAVAKSLIRLEIDNYNPDKKTGEKTVAAIEQQQRMLESELEKFIAANKRTNIETILYRLYYDTYGVMSDVKDRNNTREIVQVVYGKFEDVYQLPEIYTSSDKKWSLTDAVNRKSIIWAPNGYGKTSFLKSILFASSYSYRENMYIDDASRIKDILEFHGLESGDYFPLFIESSYFSEFPAEGYEWIYEIIRNQLGFDKNLISYSDFLLAIKKHNLDGKLIVLVDGYDELDEIYRNNFIYRINSFLSSEEYGSNATVIITSRPYFDEEKFNGYSFWTISPLNYEKNKLIIQNMIYIYIKGSNISPEVVSEMIDGNEYLREMVTTPELLVDTVRGCIEVINDPDNNLMYHIVEYAIDDLIQRIGSQQNKVVSEYGGLDEIKAIYEQLAFIAVQNESRIKEGNFSNTIEYIVGYLCKEHENKYRKLRNISDSNSVYIIDLFFTKFSLLKSDGRYVKFLSDTILQHLAAKRLLALFINAENVDMCKELLNDMGICKYKVFVIVSTLSYYLTSTSEIDTLWPIIEQCFSYFICKTWNARYTRSYERIQIRNMVIDIFTKKYGENVIVNRFISDTVLENIEIINEILETGEEEYRSCNLQYCRDLLNKLNEKSGPSYGK